MAITATISISLLLYQLGSSVYLMSFKSRPPSNPKGGTNVEKEEEVLDAEAMGGDRNLLDKLIMRKKNQQNKQLTTTKDPRLISLKLNSDKLKKRITKSFSDDLEKYADRKKTIVVGVVDHEFFNFALNFKALSLDRLKITNFLFFCIDTISWKKMTSIGIGCSLYNDINPLNSSVRASDFGTSAYHYKTNLKTAIMIQALNLGYTVLIVDLDIVLFKNPFPYFKCSDCDIHFQLDRTMYNSGFAYVRPTIGSKTLYETAWNFFIRYQRAHDQAYINMAANYLKELNQLPKIETLSMKLFPCGVYYFEHPHRMFENQPPCEDCVVLHNNYIGSVAAKLYRFRENHLWVVDENGYYSNTSNKYLTYENPLEFNDKTMEMEVSTLKIALTIASTLKRILILPSFHCCNCHPDNSCSHPRHRCSLLSVLKVNKFDRTFHKQYREHSFLNNTKVPALVKRSISPLFLINSSISSDFTSDEGSKLKVFQPADIQNGATIQEIENWLLPYKNVSVLRFHSLYGAHSRTEFDSEKFFRIRNLMEESFQCSEYEQWEKNSLEF